MSVSPNKDNCSPFSSSFKMNQDTVKNNQNPKPGGSGSYAGKHYTPSPSTQPKNRLSDRFIPCRSSANLYHKFMAQDSEPENIMKGSQNMNVSSSSSNYSQLLHNQIFCNENANNEEVTKILGSCEQIENGLINQSVPNWPKKIFKFKHELRKSEGYLPSRQTIGGMINYDRQQLLNPSKQARKIGKLPFKVLDAPQLQDDFYLNLVDWSAMNVLAVGLGSTVYIWSAYTSKVSKLPISSQKLAQGENKVFRITFELDNINLFVFAKVLCCQSGFYNIFRPNYWWHTTTHIHTMFTTFYCNGL